MNYIWNFFYVLSNFNHEEQTKIFEFDSDILASINKFDLMDLMRLN